MCPNPSQIATDSGLRHTERATNLRQAQSSQSKTRNLPPPFFQFALGGQNLGEIFTVFSRTRLDNTVGHPHTRNGRSLAQLWTSANHLRSHAACDRDVRVQPRTQ